MTAITTKAAPEALGPYSQAFMTDALMFTSGQLGLDPATGKLLEGIEAQARQVFTNLQHICEAAECSLNDTVKVTIFMTDLAHFGTVNTLMTEFFSAPYPARSCVEVSKLPKGALIEVELVVARK